MIHYPQDYWCGDVLVSVDNKVATKVSIWVDGESEPRERFTGDDAYDNAMNVAFRLSETLGYEAEMPTAESVAISLGGATFDSAY
jgi:hypothetical protein